MPTHRRLGPYEVIALLGAGGMGQVYKARDTRLDRIVAIKMLPAESAADPDRQERFEREARAAAALSHPHICTIHDVGEARASDDPHVENTVRFFVMEYLDGDTLQERLLRGALPMNEALPIALDIAAGLDHAHQKGLIHRDLKPSNVMLTATGAKLLDFGLSRLHATPDLVGLSTISSDAPLTEKGAVIGTFPYMSPEQLQGRTADARSDIFSFGAILYEMIAGRRAFEGATAAALSGAILHIDPPPLSSVQRVTGPSVERVVQRCLAKNPDDRWQTTRDLLLELRSAALGAIAVRHPVRWWNGVAAVAAVAAVVGVAVFSGSDVRLARTPATLAFAMPPGLFLANPADAGPIAISPDGERLVFVAAAGDGRPLLWVRRLASLDAHALSGTDGAVFPFWSPDSQSIAFFAQRRLKIISAAGGPVRTICESIQPRGGAMNAQGVIVFSADAGRQLYRVEGSGGEPVVIAPDNFNEERYSPIFLPDGRHYLYFGRPRARGVYVAELGTGAARLVLKDRIPIAYSPSGHLLTLAGSMRGERAGTLLASRFDAARLTIDPAASAVADAVPYYSITARGDVTVSNNGVLVYGNLANQAKVLIWFDRNGKAIDRLSGPVQFRRPRLSPDGALVAAQGFEPETQQSDLWVIETARNVRTKVTFDRAFEDLPIWSPDGSRIVFSSPRNNQPPSLYEKSLRDGAEERALLPPATNDKPTDWSRDGRLLVYASLHPRRQWDLLLLPMDVASDRRRPTPLLESDFNEQLARVSPDGRWIAYASDESGTNEVYVQTFPAPGAKRRISTAGGSDPMWRGDGRELFYLAPDGMMMAASVETGVSFVVRGVEPLFKTRVSAEWMYDANYTVTDDGQRFLINSLVDEPTGAAAVVVLDWVASLTRP